MLKKLTAYSPQLTTAPFAFPTDGSPETDILQVRDISGLGPVNADINTSRSSNVNFEVFQDSSIGKRNIVITFGLNTDWSSLTVTDIRQILEKAFMPQTQIRMVFESDEREDVEISGYVESVDPSIFSADPEVQISILCPKSDFVGMADVTLDLPIHSGLPYVDGEALDISYTGTVPTGIVFDLPELAAGSGSHEVDFSLYQKYAGLVTGMYIGDYTVYTDHGLRISTVPGDKYARTVRDIPSPDTSVLPIVSTASQWILLRPGDNKLRAGYVGVVSPSIAPDVFPNAVVTYRNRYGSI